jgi:carbon-monoxide dehydrogenase large subunit
MKTADRGRSVRRFEDFRFLTGGGRYVDDFALPGQVHAHVLRSPHAHAAIERIDTAAARDDGGVLGVFTETDLWTDGIGPLPCIAQVSTVDPMIVPPRYALARGRVRHVGDPVALVVAQTRDQARDAAERIAVEYRPLDAVADGTAALLLDAAKIWDEAPGNLCFRFRGETGRPSERHSSLRPTSSRSSSSTTGWYRRRSSRGRRSAIMTRPQAASTCC